MTRLGRILALAAVALPGCGAPESHRPPPLQACADCTVTPPGTSSGSGGGPAGAAGAAGKGGDAGAAGAPSTSISLTGSIAAITGQDFVASAPYAGAVIVTAKALDGSDTTAKGAGTYLLPDVAAGPQWLSVRPVGVDALGVLSFSSLPAKDAALDLVVVRAEALTTALGTLPKPASLAPGSAHAVVFVRTPAGAALPATRLTPAFAAEVGHDDGLGYGGLETHARGIAVLFNAKASSAAQATLEHAGTKTSVALPLAADQVTIVAFELAP